MKRILSNILWAISSRCIAWSLRLSREHFGRIPGCDLTDAYSHEVTTQYEEAP